MYGPASGNVLFLPSTEKKKIEERKLTQVLAGPAEFCSSTA